MGKYNFDPNNPEYIKTVLGKLLKSGALQVNDPLSLALLERICGKHLELYAKMEPGNLEPNFCQVVTMKGANITKPSTEAAWAKRRNGSSFLEQPIVSNTPGNVGAQKGAPSKETNPQSEDKIIGKIPAFLGGGVIRESQVREYRELPKWMDRSLSTSEMYKSAVIQTKKEMAQNPILSKKSFSQDAANGYAEMFTPEVFKYLSMKGPRAVSELRAAMYPAKVAFTHSVFNADGRTWVVPYIIVFKPHDRVKNQSLDKYGGHYTAFYLNSNGDVHGVEDKKREMKMISKAGKQLRLRWIKPI